MHDTETTCHCGTPYGPSDHCPECGCEQYEMIRCGYVTPDPGTGTRSPAIGAVCRETYAFRHAPDPCAGRVCAIALNVRDFDRDPLRFRLEVIRAHNARQTDLGACIIPDPDDPVHALAIRLIPDPDGHGTLPPRR
jgi:hypothetical protein